jgi:hypothetical protein
VYQAELSFGARVSDVLELLASGMTPKQIVKEHPDRHRARTADGRDEARPSKAGA